MAKDMTIGNPIKLMLFYSIPLLIGNIFQQLYSMVDTLIVGRFLGVKALAAVGSTGSMSFLMMGCVIGLTSGFGVLVAQKFGANNEEETKIAIGSALILSFFIAILLTIVNLFAVNPILNMINTPSDIINDSYSYISIIFGGTFILFCSNILISILRALGDSKTPLYFLIIACILNIILDVVFIVNLSMGVAGTAYATVISQGFSALLGLIYIYKKYPIFKLSKRHFKLDMEYFKKHLSIAIPMSLQFSITAIGSIVVQSSINGFGAIAVAAYTVASKVEQLFIQPCVTFGVTIATYSAQNLGANKIARIKDGVKKCTIINIGIGFLSGIILFFFGEHLVTIFMSDINKDVIAYAKQYLSTSSFFYIPLSLIFIYRNALQGMGYAFIPMIAGLGELIARVVISFTLPSLIGYAGICFAGPIAWVIAFLVLILDYNKKIKKII